MLPRRTLLQSVLTAALLPADAAPGIVDAHVHFYDPARPEGVPWPPSTDAVLYRPMLPGAWASLVQPLGVTEAIVVEASPWLEDNQWLLNLVKQNR